MESLWTAIDMEKKNSTQVRLWASFAMTDITLPAILPILQHYVV